MVTPALIVETIVALAARSAVASPEKDLTNESRLSTCVETPVRTFWMVARSLCTTTA